MIEQNAYFFSIYLKYTAINIYICIYIDNQAATTEWSNIIDQYQIGYGEMYRQSKYLVNHLEDLASGSNSGSNSAESICQLRTTYLECNNYFPNI